MPEAATPPEPRFSLKPKVESLVTRGKGMVEVGKEKVKGYTKLNVPKLKERHDALDTSDALGRVRDRLSGFLSKDKEPKSAFDTQWETPKKIQFSDGKDHDVYDISPEVPADKPPIVFIAGWNNPIPPKEIIEELVRRGRRVLFSREAHGSKGAENNIEDPIYSKAINRIAGNVKNIVTNPELAVGEEVEVVGHSLGSIAAVALARDCEQVKRLVLMNPEGVGEDSPAAVAGRFGVDMFVPNTGEKLKIRKLKKENPGRRIFTKEEMQEGEEKTRQVPAPTEPLSEVPRSKQVKVPEGSLASTFLHPVKSVQEEIAMGNTQIIEGLEVLNEKGVGVTMIGGNFDHAVPMRRLQQHALSKDIPGDPDHPDDYGQKQNVVGFVSTIGGHGFGGYERQYGALIDHTLTSMAAKQAA